MDQKVPHWDATNKRLLVDGNVAGVGSSQSHYVGHTGPGRPVVLQAFQAGNAASATLALGIAPRAGVIKAAKVAAITVLTGNDTTTVDIKRNGTTILTGVISLASGDTNRVADLGTLVAGVEVEAGDFFEAVIVATHNTGTLPVNLNVQVDLDLNEGASPYTIPLGIVSKAGVIGDVRCAAITPLVTGDTFTVDVLKNGVTVLTAPMGLLSSEAARGSVAGTLSATPSVLAVAVGDFLEAVLTHTHGGSGRAPQGIVAQARVDCTVG